MILGRCVHNEDRFVSKKIVFLVLVNPGKNVISEQADEKYEQLEREKKQKAKTKQNKTKQKQKQKQKNHGLEQGKYQHSNLIGIF